MKNLLYILLVILALSALSSCKAKGGKINPLDTNSFDSVAVGPPLVVDTDVVGINDTGSLKSPSDGKADSLAINNADTTR